MDDFKTSAERDRARMRADDLAAIGLILLTFAPLALIHLIARLWARL
jgi:hypothetical protein